MMAAPVDGNGNPDTAMSPLLNRRSTAAVAQVLHADLVGGDVTFSRVSTDTRSIERGDLFVALAGPNFDGHDFVSQAQASGAAAVMVSREVATSLPQIIVPDTRQALGEFAAAWRAGFSMPLVAITGSNGKTTVKEMLASILKQQGEVLVTQGNLNNDIGMPLTLLQLEHKHRYAVIEMGANHPAEIAYLTNIARPSVAVITNAGAAHLEGFGSLEGVAQAKGEIYSGLLADGIAVINADDTYSELWRGLAGTHTCLSFGLDQPADVSAQWQGDASGSDVSISLHGRVIAVRLQLPGRHNVMNALAACAGAIAVGIPEDVIQRGLESMRTVKGRMQAREGMNGALIIDDTYNANPFSLQAALQVLCMHKGKKILVLGDMGELGADASGMHAQAGRLARELGIDVLFATGELSKEAVHAFGEPGMHYADQQSLIAALVRTLDSNVAVLVKGSRFMHMEQVVGALLAQESN